MFQTKAVLEPFWLLGAYTCILTIIFGERRDEKLGKENVLFNIAN